MALDRFVEHVLKNALGDRAASDEIVALVNTHASGTLSNRARRILRDAMGSRADATPIITAIEASSALAETDVARLGAAIGSRHAAALFAAELIV